MEQNEQTTAAPTSSSTSKTSLTVVVAMILYTGAVIFASKHHWVHGKNTQHIDTVLVSFDRDVPNTHFYDSAIRISGRTRVLDSDTTIADAHWMDYTVYRIGQLTDTMKDKAGNVLLDSLKHPVVHITYAANFADTTFNKYIRVLSGPKSK